MSSSPKPAILPIPARIILFLLLILALACGPQAPQPLSITSPSGALQLEFLTLSGGQVGYRLSKDQKTVIDTSRLGFILKNKPALKDQFKVDRHQITEFEEKWEQPWGEDRMVHNHYRELKVFLSEAGSESPRRLNLIFRVFDDGLGFRYEFPEQAHLTEFRIMDELTEFQLTGDHTTWWIPGDWDIYEHLYNTTAFSQIEARDKQQIGFLAQTYIPENAVNTPVTMKTAEGLHLSFHEANLTDYPGMTLLIDPENLSMKAGLVGSRNHDYKAEVKTPFQTPWRTITVTDQATELISSKIILNLNEPNQIGDVSWFKPTKYAGIWWEMHVGTKSWDLASGKHGATTEHAKEMIDFAARNGIGGLLVEGWNTGWERWIGFPDREGVFDFVTPYPDYDLDEVVRYGREKGVELIMHHETSAAVRTYEQQMDTAYKLMNRLGIKAVKTGYVGPIIPEGEYHHGQYMVRHYRKVLETAASHKIAINAHEPIKATGIRRTFPNAISREGLRGQEFNAWSSDGGNPPEHLTIVPFTRMLAGPIDFTPGIFHISLDPWKPDNRINTTLAHQLALYVVIYSPIQMLPDFPGNYEGNSGFQFIKDVGVDWEQTKVLAGEVGEYVVIARQEKSTGNWFLGAVSDENEREIEVDFSFLDAREAWEITVYRDGEGANWESNPTALAAESLEFGEGEKRSRKFQLASGGGLAISMMKKK